MAPIIGLITQDSRREGLVHDLGNHGLQVAPVRFASSEIDGLLIDAQALRSEIDLDLAAQIPNTSDVFSALLLSQSERGNEPDGLTLTPSVKAFAQQLKIFQRQQDVILESKLRLSTLKTLNAEAQQSHWAEHESKTVLFYGEPGPFYLKLKDELGRKGLRVSAVLSERTAFESFRNFVPSAFIVTVSEAFCPYELLDHVHGRPDLKHMPVIAISDFQERLPDNLEHVTGLVRQGDNFQRTIRSIENLIDNSSAPTPVTAKKCAFPARDKYSGTFSAQFAERHIMAQIDLMRRRKRPLCVARISPINLESREPLSADLLPQFGSLIDSVIRRQDIVARLDWNDFLISMPATSEVQAREAIERALRIVEMSSLSGGVTASFRTQTFDLKEFQSPQQFWSLVSKISTQKRSVHQANVA